MPEPARNDALADINAVFRIGKYLLWVILLAGFVLRVVPILWGIPLHPYISSCHPDEGKVFRAILGFPGIYWTTEPFAGYGTVIQYLIGTVLFPIKLIFINLLELSDAYTIFAKIFSRLISVILGTGTIFITFSLVQRLFDEKTALLGAAFLSVAFFHTLNSPLITLDVSSSFLLILNFLLCLHAIKTQKWRDYAILGIASGFLIGTKTVLGIFMCIPFILNILQNFSPTSPPGDSDANPIPMRVRATRLLFYAGIAFVIFILFHPHIFLDFEKYIAFYMREKHDWVDRSRDTITQLLLTWEGNTVKAVGPFLPILALFGMIFPGKHNRRFKLMLVFFVIAYYGFWRWFLSPRYVIVVTPILCIFAANACMLMIRQKHKVVKFAAVALITITTLHSLYWCISGVSLRFNDTRLSATKFIMDNIPAGTVLGLSSVSEKYDWRIHRWNYPKIDFKRYRVTNFIYQPEILILNSSDFEKVIDTIRSGKLSEKYVLPQKYHREWYRYSPPSPRMFKFYEDLLIKGSMPYKLIKTFKREVNVPLEFAPPEIRIYRKMN